MADSSPGSIAWIDLTVPDADRLRDFYARVAGWTPSPVDMGGYSDYSMRNAAGVDVAGVCHTRGPNAGVPPVWLIYISVPNLDQALAQVRALGGAVLEERPMAGMKFAIVRDPAGAHVGLIQTQP